MLDKIRNLQHTATRRIVEEGISNQVDIMHDMIHQAYLEGMKQGKAQSNYETRQRISSFFVDDLDEEWGGLGHD